MGKNTLVVTISLIASAALGFVSQILFADKFGASEDMDLHFRILAIPSMVTGTSSVIFASIFIPLLSKLRLNSKEYYEYIKGTWLVVFAFGIFFIAVTATTSAAYVRPVHDVSSTQLRHLIAQMSVLIAIGSGFSLMSGYISAVLNSNKEFYHVAWTSVLPALLIIISVLFLHEELGVRSISLGYAIGFFYSLLY